MSNYPPLVELNQEKELQKVTELGKRNITFQRNHEYILGAVEEFIDKGCLPSVSLLSEELNLSRKTIYEHIKYIHYYNEDNSEQKELIDLRRQRLLNLVYQMSVDNIFDKQNCLKAIQLFYKLTEPQLNNINFIQINNYIIRQDVIDGLEPKKIKKLISIIENKNITFKTT